MKIKYVLISLLLAGVAYGSFVAVRQYTLLSSSCIKPVAHRFEVFSLKYVRLILTLQVKNNSDIDLDVRNGSFNVYVNDMYVSDIKSNHNTSLPAHTAAKMDLVIEFNPQKVLSGIAGALSSSPDLKIKLKGALTVVSNTIIVNSLKINETFTLADLVGPSDPNRNC